QRILNPTSKLATVETQADLFGDWNISLNAIYRHLDTLNKLKDDIQLHLHQEISRLTNREGRLVFYDVTNYYFETDIPDIEEQTDDG
ncbi:TPA: IS1634 family transposase, partial [Streptococcus suis]